MTRSWISPLRSGLNRATLSNSRCRPSWPICTSPVRGRTAGSWAGIGVFSSQWNLGVVGIELVEDPVGPGDGRRGVRAQVAELAGGQENLERAEARPAAVAELAGVGQEAGPADHPHVLAAVAGDGSQAAFPTELGRVVLVERHG